ncbi:O-antigen ligase [Micromonospora sp. Llam0]|nr:O-antigen ligase [Micromonospora sp. Llam0]
MVDRMSRLTVLVGAAALLGVTTILAVRNPLVASAAVALLVMVICASQMDGWRWLLALTMALLVGASSDVAALADASFYPRYVAVGGLVVWALCIRRSAAAAPPRPWTGVLIGSLWVLAGLATLSAVWSIAPFESFQRGLALLLLAGLVHLLAQRRWPDRAVMMADLRVVYLVLAVSVVVSIGYGATDGTLAAALSGSSRFQGLFSNPNMLGMVCALALPLGWAVYRETGRRAELLGIVPAAGALVLSQSRTGLVAVLVGALWVVLRHGIGTLARVAVGATAALLAGYLSGLLPSVFAASWMQQFVGRFTQSDLSNGRIRLWHMTVDLWWENHPALGYGYASRNHLYELASYDELRGFNVGLVHNSYLQMMLELGLVAAVPLLLTVLAAGWAAVRAPVNGANSGLVWLIVTGLLIQVTESAMFGTGQTYPYVFWLAVVAVLLHLPARRRSGHHRAADVPPPSPRPGPARPPAPSAEPGRSPSRVRTPVLR